MRKIVGAVLFVCSLAWLGTAGSVRRPTRSEDVSGESSQYASVTTLSTSFKRPAAVAATPAGDVYVADSGHHQIRVIRPDGRVDVIAGSGSPGSKDGIGLAAQFHEPRGIAYDTTRGVLYVADTGNHVIREVTPDGTVRTVAGSGRPGFGDGDGIQAEFRSPSGVAIDPLSNVLYVADTGNSAIRTVTPTGSVTTIATGFQQPEGIAVAGDGTLYVADTLNHIIRRVTATGTATIAGSGQPGFQDGPAAVARFHEPASIAVMDSGDLIVGDRLNQRVRLIRTRARIVETIAGIGQPSFLDGEPLNAGFHNPSGLATAGAVWIADEANDAIRMLVPEIKLTAVRPSLGPLSGGGVTIYGTGFIPGRTSVTFGKGRVTSVDVVSAAELHVTAPAASEGTVDVTVSTAGGTATLQDAFTYVAPPTIGSLSPAKGSIAGGAMVTITGSHFIEGDTSVFFGDVAASIISVTSTTGLTTAVPPSPTGGFVDVRVQTPGGVASLSRAYQYFAPPEITSFTPARGLAGTPVELTGANFDSLLSDNEVSLSGRAAQITAADANHLVVVVPAGASTAPWSVQTAGGTAVSTASFIVPTYTSIAVAPSSLSLPLGAAGSLTASGIFATGGTEEITPAVEWSSGDASVATVNGGSVEAIGVGTTTVTARLGTLTASASIAVRPALDLPPDPSTLATPPDPTVVPSLLDEFAFLYTGANAIQVGADAAAIREDRISILRGRVVDGAGAPLPGVTVSVLNHPDFGHTASRADGYYDVAVNGGGVLTLTYERDAFIAAHRQVVTHWNEQRTLDDVALLAYDSNVTQVAFPTASPQIARGSVSNDRSGSRRATLIIPANTTASVLLPDGSRASMSLLTLRATEYSVGTIGPAAMPAGLPPTSAYTYCVELSADEAVTAHASEVTFSKPIPLYVENFIGFPVGTQIPVGYYDRARSAWASSTNGRVIKLKRIANGVAFLDINGDELEDSATALAAIGIDSAEQRALAGLYPAGQTVWRASIPHLTPWDLNFSIVLPPDASTPQLPAPYWIRGTENSCRVPFHSTIDCHNRTLGEEIAIAGTSFSLLYDSGRVGHGQYTVDVNVTGATLPASVERVELDLSIAGRHFSWTYDPVPNLKQSFTWDGLDVYGRRVSGTRDALVEVKYIYAGEYAFPAPYVRDWAAATGTPFPQHIKARTDLATKQAWMIPMGHYDVSPTGFAAWMFSAQKLYDGRGRVMYDGDRNRAADPQATNRRTLSAVHTTDGLLVGGAMMAPTSDGGLYVASSSSIVYVSPSGVRATIAGSSTMGGTTDDGRTALGNPVSVRAIAVGPDDTLYFSENDDRVRRIVNGLLTTVAGTRTPPNYSESIDGKSATSVAVRALDLAVGRDGTLFMAEGPRLTAVSPDGIIRRLAGGGGCAGDDGPATSAAVNATFVAAGDDGSVYFVNAGTSSFFTGAWLRKITPDGIIRGIVPCLAGGNQGPIADGDSARSGWLQGAGGLAVAADGTILVTENISPYRRVRAIDPTGIVTTFAGTGATSATIPANGSWARTATLGSSESGPASVRIGPDGSVYITHRTSGAILKTAPLFPSARSAEIVTPSSDGSEVYIFSQGRHVRTVDALTGALIYSFTYSADGYLAAVTDSARQITHVERNAAGEPTAIVSPGGQRTALRVTGGALMSITNPASEEYVFEYEGSLLTSRRDPGGGLTTFAYDNNGLLTRDTDPAGGFISLASWGTSDNYVVERVSAEQRTVRNSVLVEANGVEQRIGTSASGTITTTALRDGSRVSTYTDGSKVTIAETPDPRFGSNAPLHSYSFALPSGKTATFAHTRTVRLADSLNSLSLTGQTDTWSNNGRTFTSEYDSQTRTVTSRTPLGRVSVFKFDNLGRVVAASRPGFAAQTIQYNDLGLVERVRDGGREISFAYNARRELTAITDPLAQTTRFAYDAAGRLTTQTFDDGRTVTWTYDADGNVTSVVPPNRAAHTFTLTSIGLNAASAAPGAAPTRYSYNRDRQVTRVERPDGAVIVHGYDAGGRLATLDTKDGRFAFSYSASTGMLSSVRTPTNGTVSYTYDGPLLVREDITGEITATINYAYDSNLRVINENGTAYAYDNDDLLTSAGSLSLSRDAATGQLTGTSVGAVSDHYTYNVHGEVTGYVATHNGTALLSLSYDHDAAGRVTTQREASFTSWTETVTTYGYDSTGRLRTVGDGAGSVRTEYVLDENGNRVERLYAGGTLRAEIDGQDRLLRYGGVTYEYNANGEMSSRTVEGVPTLFEYDYRGCLTRVRLSDGHVIDYVIDSAGRRVGKKIDGVLHKAWLYADQTRIIAELDGSGAVLARFVYGTRSNSPDLILKSGNTYRVIADGRGSPRLIVDAITGSVVQQLAYDEFGNLIADVNPDFQPFGFAGGLHDRETGLVHFGARDYDPNSGRWITTDPIGFDGRDSNLYNYAFGDPINFVDPSGLDAITSDPHALAAMAAVFRRSIMDPNHSEWTFILYTGSNGRWYCQSLGSSHARNSNTSNVPTGRPNEAWGHTHPRGMTSRADDPGDVKSASQLKPMVSYVLSFDGIHKYDPTRPSKQRESTELDNAAYKKNNNGQNWYDFQDADSCGCANLH